MAAANCSHVAEHLKKVKPQTKGCEECLKTGPEVAASAHVPGVRACGLLRLVAGPSCAGTLSMRQQHPLIQSAERGEDWKWCYHR